MLTVLDIFSGIGGFSLGLERTGGFKTIAFCEIDPFCRKVLRKHWPEVPIHDDITTLADAARQRCKKGGQLRSDERSEWSASGGPAVSDTKSNGCRQGRARRIVERGPDGKPARTVYDGPIDVICGGFPCQDISTAGRGEGIAGARSGLWSEFARLIGEIRPRYVIVENVAALLGRGLDRVLGDLSEIGFDAEWHCIPAAAVGAPHRRDRIWIVAYDAERRWGVQRDQMAAARSQRAAGGRGSAVPGPDTPPMQRQAQQRGEPHGDHAGVGRLANTHIKPVVGPAIAWRQCDQWRTEPDVGRVAHGVPSRVDRLRSLGNAVVPQVVEVIGYAILESA